MFANKSDLLSQIHSIIQKSSFTEKQRSFNPSLFLEPSNGGTHEDDFNKVLQSNEINKLEKRIEKLEDENDQLLCIALLLSERFKEMVDKMLTVCAGNESGLTCKNCDLHAVEGKGNSQRPPEKTPLLTKREMDVFNLLTKGLCAKEIAKILFISETTVISHKKNLKEKFHAKNTVELISNILRKKAVVG